MAWSVGRRWVFLSEEQCRKRLRGSVKEGAHGRAHVAWVGRAGEAPCRSASHRVLLAKVSFCHSSKNNRKLQGEWHGDKNRFAFQSQNPECSQKAMCGGQGRWDWVERTSDWRLCRNCGKSRMETMVAWVKVVWKQISRRRVELLWPRVLGFLPSALFCSSLDLGMSCPLPKLERLLLHKVSLYHLTCL